MAAPPFVPVAYSQVNIVAFSTICDLYGTDASQFQVGTLAFVRDGADTPFFVLVDTAQAPDADTTISTPNGPAQPGCTNPVAVGTSPLRWRRLTTDFAVHTP